MRIVISLLFSLLIFSVSYSQTSAKAIQDCSQILSWASEQWKLDTLECTGFRGKVSDELKKSRIDSVSKNYLLEKFGKPDYISRFYSGIDNKNYVGYRYFSVSLDCKRKPFTGELIEFVFDENEKRLIFIQELDVQ